MKRGFTNIVLLAILLVALFVRVYKTDELLGFWYDQGRDALVIWQFWHEGDFFLIGPTTGIEGIFRGPWYYWLIAPFYLFGQGNPVWPSVFLALTTVVALFILFKLGEAVGGRATAFLALLIGTFSYSLIYASRWLSNPTPMLAISMLLLLCLYFILQGKKQFWIAVAFLLGMAMQFGSSAEVFYFPAVFLFAVLNRDKLPSLKIAAFSFAALLFTFVPQIVFDIRNDGILSKNVANLLFQGEPLNMTTWLLKERGKFYYSLFMSKLFPGNIQLWLPFLVLFGVSVVFNIKQIIKNKMVLSIAIFLLLPVLGMTFYQGNYGYVFDYYFTGYYLIFVLFFSYSFILLAQKTNGWIVVAVFVAFFLHDNLDRTRSFLQSTLDSPPYVTLGNQLRAVEWVWTDSQKRAFNVDVYVPPVIPYAYDYLFLWQGDKRCGESLCGLKLEERVQLLYTVEEPDPGHPDRVEAWRARQAGIGSIEETVEFGGILVERRSRLNNEAMKQ